MLGPFVGSFLGVLIRRLPERRPVAWSRSACERCGNRLGWRELVPVASYLWQRGRCRHCAMPIGAFYPAIELLATAIAAWAVLTADGPQQALAASVLGWVLLALGWIDAQHMRLPDALTLPLVVAGLAATWWLEPWRLAQHAAGAMAGYLAFRLLAEVYRRWRGHAGLGGGDAKLLAAAGAWVGLDALPMVVLIGAAAGIVWTLAERMGHGLPARRTVIPFGPFLALAIWLVRLHGIGSGSALSRLDPLDGVKS